MMRTGDRDLLPDKLRELRLGGEVEIVERISPDPGWFDDLESWRVQFLDPPLSPFNPLPR
jgi:hypothetical protein